VVLVGPQEDIRPVVRACNVFLNEYPEGGGNTVLEAMGCGIPVVAMKAGARHAESIGAILAGEHAVWGADRGAYWAKAAEWLGNPLRASLVGEVQRRRALARYDYPVIARAYERVYEGLLGAA
jgi:glycosyltransferase involved in cell wall biosynthesis